ncbi:PTS galactitol transporter subunit IIA [Streptococcus agalactiae LMG 14747]|uniref:PTS galactitol transporter subunit IIA n=2 Tax=Streptococcus TaxID=1301 RepID=V6YYT1_STRAG|nr:PTS sugar transporter subunit IIA [Streptococcus acidominimus]ESV53678.1 PTS galactitol transporter subunit IIA [Streptococcus agalactiae LMG 14747]SNV32425.1 PTS system galactitol-specific transporter subunit IIA [Streptococcus acidominimus]
MDEELIVLQKEGLDTAQEALMFLAKRLVTKKVVKESFVEAVIEREAIFPTGLQFDGYGVALPHTDAEHVEETQIAVMTLEKPVTFTQMATVDQEVTVQLIIMLAIKEAHSQVEMLQKLIQLLQDKALVQEILACRSDQTKAVLNLLTSYHII